MNTLRLPRVHGNPTLTPIAEFIRLWMARVGPRRLQMRADIRLNRCARDHAEYLAARTLEQIEALADDGHGSHIGRGGSYPNARVRASGYALPTYFEDAKNNVEFNARTHRGPARALALLLGSDTHRPALLGEGGYADRLVYGVGNCQDDWVVLVCPSE